MNKKITLAVATTVLIGVVALTIILATKKKPADVTTTNAPVTNVPTTEAPVTKTPDVTNAPDATVEPTVEPTTTPEPTEEPKPTEPVATPTPIPYFETWQPEEDDGAPKLNFIERVELPNGGYYERYQPELPPNAKSGDILVVIGTEEKLNLPDRESPYLHDQKNPGNERCVISIKAGDNATLELWNNGVAYLKGSGKTYDFPDMGDNCVIAKVQNADYFKYDFSVSVFNASTYDSYDNYNTAPVSGGEANGNECMDFLKSIKKIYVDSGITYIGNNLISKAEFHYAEIIQK